MPAPSHRHPVDAAAVAASRDRRSAPLPRLPRLPELPRLPQWHLPRRRLLDLLPPGAPVVTVVAGAGWGKTVLLREVADRALEQGRAVAWVDLPFTCTDRERWWSEVGRVISAAAGIPPVASDVDAVIEVLGDLAAQRQRLTVVIDDVHHLEDTATQEDLRRLAERLPGHVQLAMAGRRPLGPLFGPMSVVEHAPGVGRHDLRHTVDETRSILTRVLGSRTAEGVLASVMADTDGWPALVRLHASSSGHGANSDDDGRTRQRFRRAVEDYVLDEVLTPLPPDLRSFLLDVAPLDVLTPDACDAVSGRSSSGVMLERLASLGTPLDPVDDRGALRVHRAVREVALAELVRTDLIRWIAVRHRAASHLAHIGSPLDAVDHLLEASDHVGAVEVLVDAHRSLLRDPSLQPLARRMARFPTTIARSNPDVALDLALLDASSGRFGSAARTVAALREADLTGDLRQVRTIVELAIAGVLGDVDRLSAPIEQDVPATDLPVQLPTDPSHERSLEATLPAARGSSARLRATFWSAAPVALLFADRYEECDAACRRAEHSGTPLLADPVANLGARALLAAWRGELGDAAQTLGAFRRSGGSPGATPTWPNLQGATAELLVHLETHDPADVAVSAEQLLDHLADQFERHTTLDVPVAVIALRAWRLAGEPSRAFDGSVPLVTSTPAIARPWLTSLIAEELVRCGCDLGDDAGIAAAERSLRQVRGSLALTLARAHVLVARHETAAARSVLAPVDPHLIERHSPWRAMDLFVLRQLTATTSRDLASAHDAARTIADDHGLHRALAAALDRTPRSRRHAPAGPDAASEPLSSRERDVLRLLSTDLPIAEVAQQLFVSVNTVKSHVKSVYRKLGATGRSEAVRRAHELGVLPPHR